MHRRCWVYPPARRRRRPMDRIDLTNDLVAGAIVAHTDVGDLRINPNRYNVGDELRWAAYIELEQAGGLRDASKLGATLRELLAFACDLILLENPDWDAVRVGKLDRLTLYRLISFFVYPATAQAQAMSTPEQAPTVETTAVVLPASAAAPPSPTPRKGRRVA